MAEEQTLKEKNKEGSVNSIFPLVREIKFNISDILQYSVQLRKLFDFYDKQLQFKQQTIKNGYSLKDEIEPILTFIPNLQSAIQAANIQKPVITDGVENLILSDFESIKLRIIDNDLTETQDRNFSDGTKRSIVIYNKIDSIELYKKNEATPSVVVLQTLNFPELSVSPSTISLIFNKDKILSQINKKIPDNLLLCNNQQTTLSLLQDEFLLSRITSKVLLQDFLNAYIFPIRQVVSAPRQIFKSCTPEAKLRIVNTKNKINYLKFKQNTFGSGNGLLNISDTEISELETLKKELFELLKICPDLATEEIDFRNIEELKSNIGEIYTKFINKFNLACIVEEAIKCVMPQISCEEILRDINVENYKDRLNAAFPHQRKTISAIIDRVEKNIQEENQIRAANGERPLRPEETTQNILNAINFVVDIEALCKIDIQAVVELIKNIFNFEFPSFNIFDWQFQVNIDFNLLMIRAILNSIILLIEQILNELVGCNALDNLVAGVINGNIESAGLYGDISALFGGDFDFSNLSDTLKVATENFLQQNNEELSNLVLIEKSLTNEQTNTFLKENTIIGFGTDSQNMLVANTQTNTSLFGGFLKASQTTTQQIGEDGVESQQTFTGTIDVTRLATSDGQKNFLKEIGQFEVFSDESGQQVVRISNDSITKLYSDSENVQIFRNIPATTTQQLEQQKFALFSTRTKNNHIINALVGLNEKENRLQLITTNASISQQIKDYIKTCFALLSPTETIELLSGVSNLETKLTITEICRIRFPLLFNILRYPERHERLFSLFGKLTQLDSIGPSLQLLASSPVVRQKMVDPNVCYPFSNFRDFREGLMNQVLPADLANELMDNLIEDDRKRANSLLNNLGKATQPTSLPGLAETPINRDINNNKIKEIDNALNSLVSDIFDQIKISFDGDVESFAQACASSYEDTERVYEFKNKDSVQIDGFSTANQGNENSDIINPEFAAILNSLGDKAEPKNAPNPPIENDSGYGRYFEKKVIKNKPGELIKKINENAAFSIKIEPEQQQTLIELNTSGMLNSAIEDGTRNFTTDAREETIKESVPRWNFKYKEINNEYYFQSKTAGSIPVKSGQPINYFEKISISGNVEDINSTIFDKLRTTGLLNTNNSQNSNRFEIYKKILISSLKEITSNVQYNNVESINVQSPRYETIFSDFALNTYKNIVSQYVKNVSMNLENSRLLKTKKISNLQNDDKNNQNIFLSLIDFSPIPTEKQKACGIDTHILQTNEITKRVLNAIDNTVPENLVSTNSLINTRYSDFKPGPISQNVMTGLAELFIRTSVIHNIFKALFIFDKYNYSINSYAIPENIYMFFEHKVKNDISSFNLQTDFQKEIEKIYDLYKQDEKQLIPVSDDGSNKLKSIIIYNINSVLEIIKNIVNSYELTNTNVPNIISRITSDSLLSPIIPISIQPTVSLTAQNKYNDFYDKLTSLDVYSNFYKQISTTNRDKYEKLLSFTDNFDNLNRIASSPDKLVLEAYINIGTPKRPQYLPFHFESINEYLIKEHNLRGLIHKDNFKKIINDIILAEKNYRQNNWSNASKIKFFNKEQPSQSWLNSVPKFGIRLSLIKNVDIQQSPNISLSESDLGYYDDIIIDSNNFIRQNSLDSIAQRKLNKSGMVQLFNKRTLVDPLERTGFFTKLEYTDKRQIVIPVLSEEVELPDLYYELDLNEDYDDQTFQQLYENLYSSVRQKIVNNKKFQIIADYVLLGNIGNDIALFNSLLGMANEPIYKLFDNTKQIIKNNYEIQKNAGNFKQTTKKSLYENNKNSVQQGTPTVDFLKAAATIPINILKGLATSVDPNIFLADKIVLAGKMGFIQPRYRRVEAGETIKIENSNETVVITADEAGVATDGYYNYLESGELEKKSVSNGVGNPITEWTVMAQVQNGRIQKTPTGEVVTKQGIGVTGIPYNIRNKSYVDPNFNENEEIDTFDVRPSTTIYPGEKINIPYSVASLALAPFPLFTPGLTSYNMLMPFGPLFLVLEPLIRETAEFKASIPKKQDSEISQKDENGNIVCNENDENT